MDEQKLKEYMELLRLEQRKAVLDGHGADWKEEAPIIDAINRAEQEQKTADGVEEDIDLGEITVDVGAPTEVNEPQLQSFEFTAEQPRESNDTEEFTTEQKQETPSPEVFFASIPQPQRTATPPAVASPPAITTQEPRGVTFTPPARSDAPSFQAEVATEPASKAFSELTQRVELTSPPSAVSQFQFQQIAQPSQPDDIELDDPGLSSQITFPEPTIDLGEKKPPSMLSEMASIDAALNAKPPKKKPSPKKEPQQNQQKFRPQQQKGMPRGPFPGSFFELGANRIPADTFNPEFAQNPTSQAQPSPQQPTTSGKEPPPLAQQLQAADMLAMAVDDGAESIAAVVERMSDALIRMSYRLRSVEQVIFRSLGN